MSEHMNDEHVVNIWNLRLEPWTDMLALAGGSNQPEGTRIRIASLRQGSNQRGTEQEA